MTRTRRVSHGVGGAALLLGASLLSLLALSSEAAAQPLPILDAERARLILEEISGDAAYEHVRFMSQHHRPRGGSDGLWAVAEYYERKAREYGLADVTLIKQAATGRPWNARFADLWIVEPEAERLASTLQSPLHLADFSRSADVTAELVDAGDGSAESLAALDVSGKIVLSYGSASEVMRRAVGAGAIGIISYPDPFAERSVSYPDQLRWTRLPRQGGEGYEPSFAFVLSLRQGLALRNRLAESSEPLRVRAVVDAHFDSGQGSEPWQVMVEAFVRGSEPSLAQDVVLTGHLQEEATSANDDASGTASVLEIARALNKLIDEGRLPRPRRNLRFWWVTEISSQRQYFADHPDAHRRMWVNVNQDMVGADQAQDVMRVQNITRLPAARFHFLNDVAEAVIDYMVAANNSELAQLQTGTDFYPQPHLASLGSRQRYNAKMIFFHNNTDHMTFNEAPIAVPGITFTNWPDNYIHSSDDDLWNIDRTQLGRNAAAVALIAYTMASADSASLPVLAAETAGRGYERLGRNLRLGLGWIANEPDKDAAYQRARDQVAYAAQRERLAVSSLREAHRSGARITRELLSELDREEAQALRRIELAYRQATGRQPPRPRPLTESERELQRARPVLSGGPREFLSGRSEIRRVPGLHSLMAFEVLNSVDGGRTGLEIYGYVAAEAREAGEHYFGTVAPEGVLQYLKNVAEAGLIRLERSATNSGS